MWNIRKKLNSASQKARKREYGSLTQLSDGEEQEVVQQDWKDPKGSDFIGHFT